MGTASRIALPFQLFIVLLVAWSACQSDSGKGAWMPFAAYG